MVEEFSIKIPELSNENMDIVVVINLSLQDGKLIFKGGFTKKKYGITKKKQEEKDKKIKDKEQLDLTQSIEQEDESLEF